MATDSDDELSLSSSAMEALKAFYAERDEHARRFADLESAASGGQLADDDDDDASSSSKIHSGKTDDHTKAREKAVAHVPLTMDAFTEDWNASQFWYSDDTAQLIARQLLHGTDASSTIVVVSTPSAFVALKNLVADLPQDQRPHLYLLEFDKRFAVFGSEYIAYDFHRPIKLPAFLKGCADSLICDPPFLSDDCQTKMALTMRWLSKPAPPSGSTPTRVIVSTGERMNELLTKLYKAQGVRATTYEPHHAHGLSNEFYCYANFECADWTWRT